MSFDNGNGTWKPGGDWGLGGQLYRRTLILPVGRLHGDHPHLPPRPGGHLAGSMGVREPLASLPGVALSLRMLPFRGRKGKRPRDWVSHLPRQLEPQSHRLSCSQAAERGLVCSWGALTTLRAPTAHARASGGCLASSHPESCSMSVTSPHQHFQFGTSRIFHTTEAVPM